VIPFAHVGGVPVEEVMPLLPGVTAGLFLARAWVMMRVRRRR
jgi:hypothetical protein